uniref:Transmembrane protein 59 like n=1 Tax=Meleagris gallopavo TaxID=9103 RepID=G1N0D5_MELGA
LTARSLLPPPHPPSPPCGGPRWGSDAAPGRAVCQLCALCLQDAVLSACYRGCRLFSICHFVDASAGLNTTRAECEAACAEAYVGEEEQWGCRTGCHEQLPHVQRKEQVRGVKAPSLSVLDLVSSFCTDIVSSAHSFISSTWTFYLQADDGKVVVFQVGVPSPTCWGLNGMGPSLPLLLPGPQQKEEKSPPRKEPWGKAKPMDTPQPEHDFLGCMAKRSGLPRWILAACLFLSIVVMLWLSCASLVTAPEQHVRTQVWATKAERAADPPPPCPCEHQAGPWWGLQGALGWFCALPTP